MPQTTTATAAFTAFALMVQRHYEAIRRERGEQFVTRKDHEAMAQEAKRRAVREQGAA